MRDLTALAYPRHVHKGVTEYLHVNDPEECAKAIVNGWTVDVVPDAEGLPAPVPPPVVPVEPFKARGKRK